MSEVFIFMLINKELRTSAEWFCINLVANLKKVFSIKTVYRAEIFRYLIAKKVGLALKLTVKILYKIVCWYYLPCIRKKEFIKKCFS